MEIYSLNASVNFNGNPVKLSSPILVDDEIFNRCLNGDRGINGKYWDNTDIAGVITAINGTLYDKTDEWRNIIAPVSPYTGIDTVNFFLQICPNLYYAPDGFCPAPNANNIKYPDLKLSDGTNIYNNGLEAEAPPSNFSISTYRKDLSASDPQGIPICIGCSMKWPFPDSEPFRRKFGFVILVLSSVNVVNGKFNFTDSSNTFGLMHISFDKERKDGKLQVLVWFQSRTISGNERDYWNGKTIDPLVPPSPIPDPSGPGGGGGTLDDTSDPIPFPELPTLTATATGMMKLYTPTVFQLRSLSNYMWSDEFNLDTFKKLFADPMDVIIGLSMVPVRPAVGTTETIKIGLVDTGVDCNTVENQYVIVDCGSLDIKEFFGTALDYSPYTRFSIYLPFIGTKELKTDDIMGKSISIRYTVDILSGACTAHIKCGDSVMYQYSGSCASTIPITSQNWSQLITSIIQLAGAGIATAMSGGAAAPLLPAAANTVLSAKPTIQRAGAVSGAAGFLGIQYPYLIWEHPRQSLPVGYNKFVGYPSNITQELGSLIGFTQVESIHLENIPATQNELMEIESLLKEGVIF